MLLPFAENTWEWGEKGEVSTDVGPDLQERQKLPVSCALGSTVNTSRPLELNVWEKPLKITLALKLL